MSALTTERNTIRQGDAYACLPSYGAKAAAKCYKGALIALNSGYAAPGATATGRVAVGVCLETTDNTSGADGALLVPIRSGIFKFANHGADLVVTADHGKTCYIVDDQTVAKTDGAATRSAAGKVVLVESDGVWILIGIDVTP